MSLSRRVRKGKAPMYKIGSARKYTGPPPTIDSLLWLKKLGMALMHLGLATNCRVDLAKWWETGMVSIDIEFSRTHGKRYYTRHNVPVGACLNHDTRYVLMSLLRGAGKDFVLSETSLERVSDQVLRELDLAHVHGG